MGQVKTTIEIPDDLCRRAKVLAAERETTLKRPCRARFTQVHCTESSASQEERERRARIQSLVHKMKAPNTEEMIPLRRSEIYGRWHFSGFQHSSLRLLRRRYQFSHWDSTIIAAAIVLGCRILYSEDIKHGQVIEGLRIENPFR